MTHYYDERNANGGYHDFSAQVIRDADRRHREWRDKIPGRRWRYLAVKSPVLFGKERTGSRVIAELQRRQTDFTWKRNPDGLRHTWHFRAYLNDDEHAELARLFNAREKQR